MKKTLLVCAWFFIIMGLIISIYFIVSTAIDDYWIWGKRNIDYGITGQFGDFFGGVVGTLFALAGTFLIYLTFNEQAKQNKREAFESAFFEMIRLHRENVNQIRYTKFVGSRKEIAENRRVFRLIFDEFLECYREVKRFSNSKNIDDYINKKYKEELQNIIESNNSRIDILELALINISFCIVFFGVGQEGEIILRDRFKSKYNSAYFYKLLKYIRLKPKKENNFRWHIWQEMLTLPYNELKSVNDEYYHYRKHTSVELSSFAKKLIHNKEFDKYYGGHQHRLGHYFRHLFQSIKYLNYHNELTDKEKYFYAKTLRAQLSTYEQALLFIDSISSLGMKWEYTPEYELLRSGEKKDNCKLITRYNLIKNLPGYHFFGIKYRMYYPQIKYETEESK